MKSDYTKPIEPILIFDKRFIEAKYKGDKTKAKKDHEIPKQTKEEFYFTNYRQVIWVFPLITKSKLRWGRLKKKLNSLNQPFRTIPKDELV